MTDPEEVAPQINIEDSRILRARIAELENGNAHEELTLNSNG